MKAKKSGWLKKAWAWMTRGGTGGSILMEFVLVVPLYLLLFGGMFWIGELIVSQHYRLNSMRSAAWGYGVRQDRPSDGAQVSSILQNKNVNNWNLETTFENAVRQGRYLADTSQSWIQVVGGSFNVNYKPSVWTRGWFNSGRVIQGETVGTDDGMDKRLEGTIYQHTVVMRTLGGAERESIRRRWTPQGAPHLGDKGMVPATNAEWQKVKPNKEPFPYDNTPSLASGSDRFTYSVPANEDYKRFKLLYSWSNHRGNNIQEMFTDMGDMFKDY